MACSHNIASYIHVHVYAHLKHATSYFHFTYILYSKTYVLLHQQHECERFLTHWVSTCMGVSLYGIHSGCSFSTLG